MTNRKRQRLQLQNIIERAKHFAQDGNTEALVDLQRLVARPIQSLHMVNGYLESAHGAIESLLPEHIGFPVDFNDDLPVIDAPAAKLGRDIIFPTSWSPASMNIMTGAIGSGRPCGQFKEDPLNHKVEYWWPLNIYIVHNGNHSIVQGILASEGEVTPEVGYNYSKYYEKYRFDGISWIDIKSGKKVGKPRYPELGIIFEIGRFLLDFSIPTISLINFTAAQQISEYWELLGKHNIQYHLDDDLEDILWDGYPDQKLPDNLFKVLNENHARLWMFCTSKGISPWDYVSLECQDQ